MNRYAIATLLLLLAGLPALAPARAQPPPGGSTVYLPMIGHHAPPDPFGINLLYQLGPPSGVAQMRAAGADWATVVLSWPDIEPAEGQLNWSDTDAHVGAVYGAGMQVWALFYGDPRWAWLPDGSATIPEKRTAFLRALVERYDCDGRDDAPGSPCIDYWSFYGEPDAYYRYLAFTPGAKGYWGRRGSEYADMIAAAAQVVHAGNPRAKVAVGGIAYDWFEEQGGPFVRSFLEDVFAGLDARHGGVAATLDMVAFHYYPLNFPTIRDKALKIRAIMALHGVGHLPLFVPESGFWSAASLQSSERRQAEWLVQLYARALSVGVQSVSWYYIFDTSQGTGEVGLFHGQDLGRPKESYRAYQTLSRELAQARLLAPLALPGVEGYVFQTLHRSQQTVLWGMGGKRTAPFKETCLRVVDVTGAVAAPVRDGDPAWDQDRKVNGSITLLLLSNVPLYVSPC